MIWDKDRILKELRRLAKADEDLSYNAMAQTNQSLVSAAAYHFGSYRTAVTEAGLDYSEVTRRPRWTRQAIIRIIKDARKAGQDLHWSAVTRRRDDLGRAAFAALQPRLFGGWDKALAAAGLQASRISRYRRWCRDSILAELKGRAARAKPLNSGATQRTDPGLHAAAVRHFGSYDQALAAAGLDPTQYRQRHAWTRPEVLRQLRDAHRNGQSLANSAMRRQDPALYGAAVRLFGSFTTARTAAGLKWKRGE